MAGLFRDIDSPISLNFLDRFPTQDKADWLSRKRFAGGLRSAGYCGRKNRAVLHAHLAHAPRGLGDLPGVFADLTGARAATTRRGAGCVGPGLRDVSAVTRVRAGTARRGHVGCCVGNDARCWRADAACVPKRIGHVFPKALPAFAAPDMLAGRQPPGTT